MSQIQGREQVDAVVTGTVTATGPLTDAQLRAAVVPVAEGARTGTLGNGAQVAINATPAIIRAAGAAKAVIIQNVGAENIRIGAAGVSATTGLRLIAGQMITFTDLSVVTTDIYGVREGASDSTALGQAIT